MTRTTKMDTKDWESYLDGFKAAHLDHRMGERNEAVFQDSYNPIAGRKRLYRSAGYRKGWFCPCNT